MKKLLLLLLLLSQACFAKQIIHTWLPANAFRIANASDQSDHHQFPLKHYSLDAFIVKNTAYKPSFDRKITLENASQLAVYAQLRLISYNLTNSFYVFELTFEPKIWMMNDLSTASPPSKQIHATITFDKTNNGIFVIQGKMFKKEVDEVATSTPPTDSSDVEFSVSKNNNIHVKILKDIPITVTVDE